MIHIVALAVLYFLAQPMYTNHPATEKGLLSLDWK